MPVSHALQPELRCLQGAVRICTCRDVFCGEDGIELKSHLMCFGHVWQLGFLSDLQHFL